MTALTDAQAQAVQAQEALAVEAQEALAVEAQAREDLAVDVTTTTTPPQTTTPPVCIALHACVRTSSLSDSKAFVHVFICSCNPGISTSGNFLAEHISPYEYWPLSTW